MSLTEVFQPQVTPELKCLIGWTVKCWLHKSYWHWCSMVADCQLDASTDLSRHTCFSSRNTERQFMTCEICSVSEWAIYYTKVNVAHCEFTLFFGRMTWLCLGVPPLSSQGMCEKTFLFHVVLISLDFRWTQWWNLQIVNRRKICCCVRVNTGIRQSHDHMLILLPVLW